MIAPAESVPPDAAAAACAMQPHALKYFRHATPDFDTRPRDELPPPARGVMPCRTVDAKRLPSGDAVRARRRGGYASPAYLSREDRASDEMMRCAEV